MGSGVRCGLLRWRSPRRFDSPALEQVLHQRGLAGPQEARDDDSWHDCVEVGAKRMMLREWAVGWNGADARHSASGVHTTRTVTSRRTVCAGRVRAKQPLLISGAEDYSCLSERFGARSGHSADNEEI
jgi:hypothetical protein